MRTPPFLRIGVPILVLIIAAAYFATHPWVLHPGDRFDLWDGPAASASVGHLMDELELTDAQKQQIAGCGKASWIGAKGERPSSMF